MHGRFILILAILLFTGRSVTAQSAGTPEQRATAKLQLAQCGLKVSGMTCAGCAGAVEDGLLKVPGVKAAKVDAAKGEAKVEYDSKKTTPGKIVGAFNEQSSGFRVELSDSKKK